MVVNRDESIIMFYRISHELRARNVAEIGHESGVVFANRVVGHANGLAFLVSS